MLLNRKTYMGGCRKIMSMAPQEMLTGQETVPQTREVQEPAVEDISGVSIDEAALGAISQEASRASKDYSVSSFKCPCGLSHGHATDKHRTSDAFGMGHDEASDMPMNPNCHCGLNYLASQGHGGAQSRAGNAPVPEKVNAALGR